MALGNNDNIIIQNNVNLDAELKAELDRERAKVKELTADVDRYIQQWREASEEVEHLNEIIAQLESDSGVDVLKERINELTRATSVAAEEFEGFLRYAHLIDEDGWFADDRLYEWFSAVKEGAITAGQAIANVKAEFGDFIRETMTGNGAFDSQMIQQFTATLSNLSQVIVDIQSRLISMQENGVSVASGNGSLDGTFTTIDQIRASVESMSAEARAAYQPVTQLVEKIVELTTADSTKIMAVSQAFRGLAEFGRGSYSTSKINNIVDLIRQLHSITSSGNNVIRFEMTGVNDLHVSKASMRNLAEYLPTISKINVDKLKSLSEVNLTNFNNVKVSKASMEAIAQLNDALKELNNTKVAVAKESNGSIDIDALTSGSNPVGDVKRQIAATVAEQEELAYAEWNKIQKEQQRVHDQTIISWNKVGDAAEKEEQRIERATQREIESHYKAEQASEEAAFKELEARKSAEEKKQSEIAKSLADFETKLQKEEADVVASTQKELDAYLQSEESREAKIEKENEKLFQSHVKTSVQRRELEEQRAHEENEAYQSGLRKAEQAAAKEVELEKQKYQQELDALEKYERAREAKIEKENEKLFQSHVRASQDANLQAKWQSQGLTESNIKSLFGKAEKNQDLFEDFNNLRDRYQEVLRLHKEWKRNGSSTDKSVTKPIEDATRALKMEIEAILELNAEEKKSEATESKRQDLLKRGYKLLQQLVKEEQNWTSAKHGKTSGAYQSIIKYREELELLLREFESGKIAEEDFNSRLGEISKSAQISGQMISANGKATKAWIDRVGGLASKFASWFSLTRVIMAVVGKIREMISNVIEVDSALGQLRIVTQASTSDLNQYAQSIGDVAERTGASITDLIDSTTTYARLGYNLTQSSTLAEYTSMLSKVGAVDVKDAQSAVTAITKAFKEVDADDIESVLDKLVKVGNSFPISTAEISEGLNNAASALAASGNTFEKSVALLTAANTTVNLCRAA